MRRTRRGGWPYSQPPNAQFTINRASPQADGLVLWMPWGGGTPGAHRHVDRIRGLEFTEAGTPVWVSDGERGWSLLFDDAAHEYLGALAPVTGPPFSMAAWMYPIQLFDGDQIIGISSNTVDKQLHYLRINATPRLEAVARVGNQTESALSNVAPSVNVWQHACGVWAAANYRQVFLNGRPGVASAVALAPGSINQCNIAVQHIRAAAAQIYQSYYDGCLTDVRIYNVAKTDAEVYQMYANPWELHKPLIRRFPGWKSPAPPPVGGHMTLWGRYWGP